MIEKINIIHYLLNENVNELKGLRESIQKEFEYILSNSANESLLKAKQKQLKGFDFLLKNLETEIDLFYKIIETMQRIQPTIKAGINAQLNLFTDQFKLIAQNLEKLQDLKEVKDVKTATKPTLKKAHLMLMKLKTPETKEAIKNIIINDLHNIK